MTSFAMPQGVTVEEMLKAMGQQPQPEPKPKQQQRRTAKPET
jgi:hypothetical protein